MPEVVRTNQILFDECPVTWSGLLDGAERKGLASRLREADRPAAIVVDDARAAFEAVALLAGGEWDGMMLGRERLSPAVREMLSNSGYAVIDAASGEVGVPKVPARTVAGRIALLTSGSTGVPKLVQHQWNTLFTGRNMQRVSARRWLVPYQAGTYAWYQVVTLGLFQKDQTLIPVDVSDLVRLFQVAGRTRADSISATPTFWRQAMLSVPRADLQAVPFRSITLGGETADRKILDWLLALYPSAQLTHIYASTEAGACIVVKDGQAGFPAGILERNDPSLPEVKLQDGRLWVRSPYSSRAAEGRADSWIDTGDLVERRGDRVFFVGRADSAMINVGGNKAYPADIEAVLLAHPAILWCRVRGVKSPFVGNLPEADVFFAEGRPAPEETDLVAFCKGKLPEYAIPRFWNRLESIPLQSTLKSPL